MINELTPLRQLGHAFNTSVAQQRIEPVAQESDRDPPRAPVERAESHPNPLPSNTRDMMPPMSATTPNLSSETATATTPQEIFLQFWFEAPSTIFQSFESFPSVRASTTATPVPYNLGSGTASLEQLRESKYYGAYDSRMDSTITSPTLPGIVSKVIDFKQPFNNVPEVAVWLTGLSSTTGATVSVNATATNITTSQFTLRIDGSAGAELISVGIAWAVWTWCDKVITEYCARPDLASSRAKYLQLSAVSGVKLVLNQSVFLELVVNGEDLPDGGVLWHYGWKQGGETGISGTVVNAIRFSY